jgi:hypothetical protein
MPEMSRLCGERFRVSGRALTTCFSGTDPHRGFHDDDLVTLDDVRCSGAEHDGCEKACLIFWREAWLRRIDGAAASAAASNGGSERLRARLKTTSTPDTYYCQASELAKISEPIPRTAKLRRYVAALLAGNFSFCQMCSGIAIWGCSRARRALSGTIASRRQLPAPTESLGLAAGEWVEIKPLSAIVPTLDERGFNRGLFFSPDMRRMCGQRRRVKTRLDRIIVDGTGKMRRLRDTVALENSTCGCAYMGLGMAGCARCELTYWREIWLRRIDGAGEPAPAGELAGTG